MASKKILRKTAAVPPDFKPAEAPAAMGIQKAPPSLRGDEDSDADSTKIGDRLETSKVNRRDRAHLIVLAGESLGGMFRIEQPEVVIGRAVDTDIRLRDGGVSRRHARIVLNQGALCIEDLDSANGTLLNGDRIKRAVLRDGDHIQMGSTTILKFTFSDELEENFRQRMYDAALYDPLTKACNKRHFVHRLQTEVAYARRHRTSLSLLMLDIDDFKRINDGHGHQAGDSVLATLGQIVSAALRVEDVFARYGGEEFAILCRGTTVDKALVLAERLRARIEAFVFEHEGQRVPVTVSVGVAAWFDQPDAETQLVANADEALFKAKRRGRNRVVVRAFRDG
jgi:two-component system cell cycle response regulator